MRISFDVDSKSAVIVTSRPWNVGLGKKPKRSFKVEVSLLFPEGNCGDEVEFIGDSVTMLQLFEDTVAGIKTLKKHHEASLPSE
jgi:hypothetical protein